MSRDFLPNNGEKKNAFEILGELFGDVGGSDTSRNVPGTIP
jgi:hypothetical protein